MLTFPEEVVRLLLNDEEGVFLPIGKTTLEFALTGSVLMELAFADRLDTDLERVMTVDRAPIGDSLLVGQTTARLWRNLRGVFPNHCPGTRRAFSSPARKRTGFSAPPVSRKRRKAARKTCASARGSTSRRRASGT